MNLIMTAGVAEYAEFSNGIVSSVVNSENLAQTYVCGSIVIIVDQSTNKNSAELNNV